MPPNSIQLAKQEMAVILEDRRPLIASPFNPNPKNLNESGKALNPDRKDFDHATM